MLPEAWLSRFAVTFVAVAFSICLSACRKDDARSFDLTLVGLSSTDTPDTFIGTKSIEYLLPFDAAGSSGKCRNTRWIPKISWIELDAGQADGMKLRETNLFSYDELSAPSMNIQRQITFSAPSILELQSTARTKLKTIKFSERAIMVGSVEPFGAEKGLSLAGDLARIGGGVVAVKGQRQNPSVGHTTQIDNASESEFNYPKDPITFADVDAFHRIVHESICGAPEVGMTPKVFLVTGNKNADLGGLSPPTAGQQPPPNAPAEATQIANSAKTPILSKSAPPSSEGQRAFDRGMVHVQQGNLDLAIKEFSSAIDAAPKYAAAFSNRGVAQLRQKNFGRALDDFKKAVELEPQNPVWHYNMAAYYSLKQETDRGLDSLDQALKLGFATSDNTQIDLLKFDAKADADLANLRKRRTDYCAVLERHSKFLCK